MWVRSLGQEDLLEKEMATHSSILAWKIPWMVEPGRFLIAFPGGTSSKESTCQCRRCKRCRFDPWVRKIPWRREWQPTPVFLPGESHGQRGLVGYRPWGHKETDTTERVTHTHTHTHTRWEVCELTGYKISFHNIYAGQIIILYTLIILQFICELYLKIAEKKFSHMFKFKKKNAYLES